MTRPDEAHLRFAMVVGAVMLTLGLAQALQVSGLFAGLALGIACRWMQGRGKITRIGFEGGGDVFFIVLHLHAVLQHAPLALAFVAARVLAKAGTVYGCGRLLGGTHTQSAASGLLLLPMAGLAIGLVQTTTQLAPALGAEVGAIILAAVAVFETIGPPIAAYAMRLSGEAGRAPH